MANIAIFSKNPDSHLSENIPTTIIEKYLFCCIYKEISKQ